MSTGTDSLEYFAPTELGFGIELRVAINIMLLRSYSKTAH